MMMNGERVNLWQYEKKHQAKTTRYSFYVRDNGSPVKLHQHGNDIFTGSHFDKWLVRLSCMPSAERFGILSPGHHIIALKTHKTQSLSHPAIIICCTTDEAVLHARQCECEKVLPEMSSVPPVSHGLGRAVSRGNCCTDEVVRSCCRWTLHLTSRGRPRALFSTRPSSVMV